VREPAQLPFLARPGYRRRRLIEAIRLLPYTGLLFFLFPLLWPERETAVQKTSSGAIYLFAAWLVLIVAAAVCARVLGRFEAEDRGDGGPR